jgi:hypothetical protein
MSQTLTLAPALSPDFERARKLSRFMAVMFTIAFWMTLLGTIVILAIPFVPYRPHGDMSVFGHFARDEIFVLPVIGHIRRAGLWLVISFFANIAGQTALRLTGLIPREQAHGTAWPLVIGIVTFIAAHVMAEAQRIASDHAEII